MNIHGMERATIFFFFFLRLSSSLDLLVRCIHCAQISDGLLRVLVQSLAALNLGRRFDILHCAVRHGIAKLIGALLYYRHMDCEGQCGHTDAEQAMGEWIGEYWADGWLHCRLCSFLES